MERLETLTKIEIGRGRQRTYPSGRKVNSPLNSSGSLRDSIESKKQEVKDAMLAFGLMGNDYALDINSGTPKSKAPSQVKLVNWIKTKPVQLRDKKGKIMKRTLIILIVSLTLCVAGILYGNYPQTSEREAATLEEAYNAQYPEQLPDVVMDPMVGFPLY